MIDLDTGLKQVKISLQEGGGQSSTVAPAKSVETVNALVAYIGQDALDSSSARFDPGSIQVSFLVKLAVGLELTGRNQLLNAIADQIRYPNTHTNFFLKMMLHLWGAEEADQTQDELREQISRIVYERLTVARPHVWGMTILFMELQQSGIHGFWDSVAPDSNMQQRMQQAMRTPH
jgi:CCR4-NOT transcription complex subunit 1